MRTYSNELESGKIATATGALEGFPDAGCADAVGDVDYAGEFFEVGEEGDGYASVAGEGWVEDGELGCCCVGAAGRWEDREQEESAAEAHGFGKGVCYMSCIRKGFHCH